MDPVSIAAASASIAVSAMTLGRNITSFVSDVRGARKDMDAVMRELTSLRLCIVALGDDDENGHMSFSAEMHDQIRKILVNIEFVFNEINTILRKVSSGRLGRRIQWTVSEKDAMATWRSSLEANKAALEIALTTNTISMLAHQRSSLDKQGSDMKTVLEQTHAISISTTTISNKLDALTEVQRDISKLSSINEEMTNLKEQLAGLSKENQQTVQMFVKQSEACTQSMLDRVSFELSSRQLLGTEDLQQQALKVENSRIDHGHVPIPSEVPINGNVDEKLAELQVTFEGIVVQYQKQRESKESHLRTTTDVRHLDVDNQESSDRQDQVPKAKYDALAKLYTQLRQEHLSLLDTAKDTKTTSAKHHENGSVDESRYRALEKQYMQLQDKHETILAKLNRAEAMFRNAIDRREIEHIKLRVTSKSRLEEVEKLSSDNHDLEEEVQLSHKRAQQLISLNIMLEDRLSNMSSATVLKPLMEILQATKQLDLGRNPDWLDKKSKKAESRGDVDGLQDVLKRRRLITRLHTTIVTLAENNDMAKEALLTRATWRRDTSKTEFLAVYRTLQDLEYQLLAEKDMALRKTVTKDLLYLISSLKILPCKHTPFSDHHVFVYLY